MHYQLRHDISQEQLLRPFLDLCYAAHGIRVDRYSDPVLQAKGIDAVLSRDRRSFLVDEKAQLHYIGRNLPTCAFEVELLKNGEPHIGWFYIPLLSTEVYALICDIKVKTQADHINETSDVCSAEIILVNRTRLMKLLHGHGLTKTFVQTKAAELRRGSVDRVDITYPGVRLVRSTQLREQPINLLVTRKVLRSIGQVVRAMPTS
jgi:hypothetical protein